MMYFIYFVCYLSSTARMWMPGGHRILTILFLTVAPTVGPWLGINQVLRKYFSVGVIMRGWLVCPYRFKKSTNMPVADRFIYYSFHLR